MTNAGARRDPIDLGSPRPGEGSGVAGTRLCHLQFIAKTVVQHGFH